MRTAVHRPKRRSAFTLVELLVVIGIIALLMSILLPTLGRVREQANMIKCGSNLRQFGQVLHLYANQNNGRVPLGYNGASARHGGYMVAQDGEWRVLGTLYESRLLQDGIEGFYCPSKLDTRWQYDSPDNPWPPPSPAPRLNRLGMTVRPAVQFSTAAGKGMVPVSSTLDKEAYRGKFPQLSQMRGQAIAAEMFGEPVNAGIAVNPTVLPHNNMLNVAFADGSVRAIDTRVLNKNNNSQSIKSLLKQLADAGAGYTDPTIQKQVYLDETVMPNTGIWAIFDQQ
ncbi:MAG TPA: prepilin-type N-terminal cleavage/methylation domain-containing protein [Humisphaera sp.]